MRRLILVKINEKPYIVDTYKSHNLVYRCTDSNLSKPIGQLDPQRKSFLIPVKHNSRKQIKQLKALHNKIKKIKIESENLRLVESVLGLKMNPYVIDLNEASILLGGAGQEEELDAESEKEEASALETDDLSVEFLDQEPEIVLQLPEESENMVYVEHVKQKKAEYEMVYDVSKRQDFLSDEIRASLIQLNLSDDDTIDSIIDTYLELTLKNATYRSPDSINNPITYAYLKNLASPSDVSSYQQPWLIPIVNDIKKVYDDPEVGDQTAGISLSDEVKNETILFKKPEKTEQDVMTDYIGSRHRYVAPKDAKPFDTPDKDRQDYTIHVLRQATLSGGKCNIRKAYGPVFKTINRFERGVETKYYPVLEGEHIDMVGFLRLPINLPNWKFMNHIDKNVTFFVPDNNISDWSQSGYTVKGYKSPDELSHKITDHVQSICAVIFPQSAEVNEIHKIVNLFVPHLDNILKLHQRFLKKIDNLDQLEKIFNYYELSPQDLSSSDYATVVNQLNDNILKKNADFLQQRKSLDELLKINVLPEGKIDSPIELPFLQDPVIIKAYGTYPFAGNINDSGTNRAIWITRQRDAGKLYYLMDRRRYLLQSIETGKKTNIKSQLDKKTHHLQQLTGELETLINQHTTLIQRAKEFGYRPSHEKPLVYVDSERLMPSFENVYVLDQNHNVYSPLLVYTKQHQIDQTQLEKDYLLALDHIVTSKDQLMTNLGKEIQKAEINIQLLNKISRKVNQRTPIEIQIDVKQLRIRNSTIEQLINRLGKHDQDAINALRDIINTRGVLKNHTYIDSETNDVIGCEHINITLYDDPEDKYLDIYQHEHVCRYCHAIFDIDDIDTVVFGEDGLETRDASEINALLAGPKLPELSLEDVLDCSKRDHESGEYYACQVMNYLRLNQLLMVHRLSPRQINTVIIQYTVFLKVSDVNINASLNIEDNLKLMEQITDSDANLRELILKSVIDRFLLVIIAIASVSKSVSIAHVFSQLDLINVLNDEHLTKSDQEHKFTEMVYKISLIVKKKPLNERQKQFLLVDDMSLPQYASQTITRYYQQLSNESFIEPNYRDKKTPTTATTASDELGPTPSSANLDDQRRYLSLQLIQQNEKLTHTIFELIQSSELATVLTESLPEPDCYKSIAELSEVVDNFSIICSITLDLYIDYIISGPEGPVEQLTSQDVLTRSNIYKDLQDNTILHQIIDNDDVIATKQEISQLHQKLTHIAQQQKDLLSHKSKHFEQTNKTVSKIHDYQFVFSLQKDKPHIFPHDVYQKPVDISNIKDLPNLLEEQVKLLNGKLIQFNKNKKNSEKKTFDSNKLKKIGSLSSDDYINQINKLKYTHDYQWDDYIRVSLITRELDCLKQARCDALRGHFYLLHYMMYRLKTQFFYPLRDKEGYRIKFDEEYGEILKTYKFTLTNQQIDQLVGHSSDYLDNIDTPLRSLIDKAVQITSSKETPKHTGVSVDMVSTYLNYQLIRELNENWPSGRDTGKYATLVEIFLEIILSEQDINDTSNNEIDMKIIRHASQRKTVQKKSMLTEEAIHRERKRLGFKGGDEPSHSIEEPVTKVQNDGDMEYTAEDNVGGFGGEIDTDGQAEGMDDLL